MEVGTEQCPLCGTELSRVKFREIQAKLREEEQRKAAELAQTERVLRQRLDQEFRLTLEKQTQAAEKKAKNQAQVGINKALAERDRAANKLKEAEAREVAARKQVAETAEKQRVKELAEQRQAFEAENTRALLKQQSTFARERESYQKKMFELQKKLEKKTANELGDGAEIDLLDALRGAFPGDKITPIRKGQPGADILHEVFYKGQLCGKIILDSKNHQRWLSEFVTKLRQDQMEAQAEHAILATTAFPAGKKEICIESDVIVVAPARVVYITQILRDALVTMHVKGLSLRERSTKMSRLYKLITSESYAHRFAEADKLAGRILELDVEEKRTHDNVWKKRGSLATQMRNALREIETDVAAVIEGDEAAEPMAAFPVKAVARTSAASNSDESIAWNKH